MKKKSIHKSLCGLASWPTSMVRMPLNDYTFYTEISQ